jgi:phosphopantetheine--protein transferase-like protein
MLVHETTCLPAGFRHLEVFPAEVDGVALDVRVLLTDDGYDVDIDTETEAVLRLRGLKFADTGPFNAKDLPKPADGFKKGQRVETSHSVPDASLFDSPDWSRYHTRGTTKRITDRLAGRSAAKLALGSYLKCDPKQIHIDNHASGQPFCREYPELFLSISHCDGLGLATVSEQPVGMDVEKLEPRSTSFRNRFFTQNERALVQNDAKKINVLWTVKEATLKLLQLGLRVSPLDIEVVTLGNSHATISVHGKVADLFGATISKSIRIRHQQVHNYCIATALWHPHANTPLPFLEAPRDAA